MIVWFAASELAARNLPDLPTDRNIRDKAIREKWQSRKRRKGKGMEYHINSLPEAAKTALQHQLDTERIGKQLQTQPKTQDLAISGEVIQTEHLKSWQREKLEARMVVLQEVSRRAEREGVNEALKSIVFLAEYGGLSETVMNALTVARGKTEGGKEETITVRTLQRWRKDAKKGQSALAPKPPKSEEIPLWVSPLLKLYQKPQKPALTEAYALLPGKLAKGVEMPSISQVRRFLNEKMGAVSLLKGRMGPRELKTIKGHKIRDFSELLPADVYATDGHTFDAEIAHRDHGRPFRPEITTTIDVATRKIVGFSAGLSESTWTVLDSYRHAIETNGVCAIAYTDRGSGYMNKVVTGDVTGFMARLSITHKTALPYNSQARGVIERVHQTVWVRLARELATFVGKDMDPEARKKAFKATRKDIKELGISRLLPTWQEFLEAAERAVVHYNTQHEHTSLPKFRDPETGKLRHQTPGETWNLAIEGGWSPVMLEDRQMADVFRPYKECTVRRDRIRLHTHTYFHKDLEEYHENTVKVGYDIHDATKVWVRDEEDRLICVAEINGNKVGFFPKSVIEQARDKRETGRLRLLDAHRDEITAEREGSLHLVAPALTELEKAQADEQLLKMGVDEEEEEEVNQNIITPKGGNGRPLFKGVMAEQQWGKWVYENWDLATEKDQDEFNQKMASFNFRLLIGLEGDDEDDEPQKAIG